MRVEWTLFAMNDREAIFDYLEADSPRAAILIDDRIGDRANLWSDGTALSGEWRAPSMGLRLTGIKEYPAFSIKPLIRQSEGVHHAAARPQDVFHQPRR